MKPEYYELLTCPRCGSTITVSLADDKLNMVTWCENGHITVELDRSPHEPKMVYLSIR